MCNSDNNVCSTFLAGTADKKAFTYTPFYQVY